MASIKKISEIGIYDEFNVLANEFKNHPLLLSNDYKYASGKNGYRIVMIPDSKISNNSPSFIELDTVSNVTINSNSSLSEYPLVNGDMTSDHICKEPITMSISGTFGLIGNIQTSFYGNHDDRLSNIEDYFESLKNNGITTSIVMRSRKDGKTRFLSRNNMMLYQIQWTHNQNTLDFRFDFKEIIYAELLNVKAEDQKTDSNEPTITDGVTRSFTEMFLNFNQIYLYIIQVLYEGGYVTSDFLNYYVSESELLKEIDFQSQSLILDWVAYGVAGTVGAIVAGVAIGAAVSGPVGWVVFGIAAVIAGIWAAVGGSISNHKADTSYKIEQLKMYDEDSKNQQEVDNLDSFISEVYEQLDVLNKTISVYSFTYNGAQECLLNMNEYYYTFIISKNNTTDEWELTTVDSSSNGLGVDRGPLKNICSASINEVEGKQIFRTPSNGYYVYLINTKLYEARNKTYYDGNTELNNELRNEEIDKVLKDVTNYAVVVSTSDLKDFNQKLQETINNAMTR